MYLALHKIKGVYCTEIQDTNSLFFRHIVTNINPPNSRQNNQMMKRNSANERPDNKKPNLNPPNRGRSRTQHAPVIQVNTLETSFPLQLIGDESLEAKIAKKSNIPIDEIKIIKQANQLRGTQVWAIKMQNTNDLPKFPPLPEIHYIPPNLPENDDYYLFCKHCAWFKKKPIQVSKIINLSKGVFSLTKFVHLVIFPFLERCNESFL